MYIIFRDPAIYIKSQLWVPNFYHHIFCCSQIPGKYQDFKNKYGYDVWFYDLWYDFMLISIPHVKEESTVFDAKQQFES